LITDWWTVLRQRDSCNVSSIWWRTRNIVEDLAKVEPRTSLE